jgi:hypothetical protein
MIHYISDGYRIKLGLNFGFSRGGFRLVWAWYDFATHTATSYRLRVRLHIRPFILWEASKFNVIDSYMAAHDLTMVESEVLNDLIATEESEKRTNEPYAIIKPK